MESAAGLAALVLFVLWLGYYVPHRVRHRQHLAEARTDDRFSGALRVLAVTGRESVEPEERTTIQLGAPTAEGHEVTGAHRSLLRAAPARGSGTRELGAPSFPPQDETEGTHAVESTDKADPSRSSAPTHVGRPGSASRLLVLERRAAAARRRLTITLLLVVLTIACWVVVGSGAMTWAAAVLPTVLLGVTLLLGRHAVVSARRSDAAWLAERRAAGLASARTRASVPGTRADGHVNRQRVTGLAVHASTANTQMIPQVTREDLLRAARRVAAEPAPEVGESEMPATPVVSATDDGAPDMGERVPSGRAWDPIPVPPPTYTMKPSAPRREPAPLSGAMEQVPVRPRHSAEPPTVGPAASRWNRPHEGAPETTGVAPRDPVPGDEPKPKTETLGLDLNEILARRRAAGQ